MAIIACFFRKQDCLGPVSEVLLHIFLKSLIIFKFSVIFNAKDYLTVGLSHQSLRTHYLSEGHLLPISSLTCPMNLSISSIIET